MAWTNLTFAFGSVLTSAKMTQLDDNLDALVAKASGAPVLGTDYIVKDMVADDAIIQANIETLTGSAAGTVSGGFSANVAMDPYCFFPMIQSANKELVLTGHPTDAADPDAPRLGFYNTGGSLRAYDVDWRYIVT